MAERFFGAMGTATNRGMQGLLIRQFKVLNEYNDVLACAPWDDSLGVDNAGGLVTPLQTVYVAKPYQLRNSVLASVYANPPYYHSSITPVNGTVIFAAYLGSPEFVDMSDVISGASELYPCNWQDLNLDGRSFQGMHLAKVTTALTSGTTFYVSLYDNGYSNPATATAVEVTSMVSGATLALTAKVLVYQDINGDYWWDAGGAGGGTPTVIYARWANTSLAADTGVTPTSGDTMLLINASGSAVAGLYSYNGSTYTFVSTPSAVIVGNLGGVYGGLTFTIDSTQSAYVAGGYAWA